MTDDASEYGRLLAERDRLIEDGADPAELEMPLRPRGDPMTREDPVRAALHRFVDEWMTPAQAEHRENWYAKAEYAYEHTWEPVRRAIALAASPADGAGASYADREVAVTGGVALRGQLAASPADGAGVNPYYESAKRGTEQWVELFEAHNRGDDLGPIFERHVIEAGERIDAALEGASDE